MKIKSTIVFCVFVLLIVISVMIFVPKFFMDYSVSSTIQSSDNIKRYSVEEIVNESDNVLIGTIIKADVDGDGVLYTMTVSFKDVFKGRNYATMGYAYVKGPQNLNISKTYLFLGDTGTEKYHYYEPFEKAPWIFEIGADDLLKHCSNGDISLLLDFQDLSLSSVKDICKNVNNQ